MQLVMKHQLDYSTHSMNDECYSFNISISVMKISAKGMQSIIQNIESITVDALLGNSCDVIRFSTHWKFFS